MWDQEGSGCWLSPSKTCAAEDNVTQPFEMCPKGYCNPFLSGGNDTNIVEFHIEK